MDPNRIPAAIIPSPPVIPHCTDKHARTESQRRRQGAVEYRRGIVDRHINPLGISRRDVNDTRAGFLARRHHLLGCRLQIADFLRPGPQQLDRRRYVFGLKRKRHAQRLRPVEMIGEQFDDIGKARQRLNRRIPRHRIDLREIIRRDGPRVIHNPLIGLIDLLRKRRRR
jgi:hypothetical protein